MNYPGSTPPPRYLSPEPAAERLLIGLLNFARLRLLAAILLCGLILCGWAWIRWHSRLDQVPSRTFDLQNDWRQQWTPIGGRWSVADGLMHNDSYERGAKLLTGSTAWRDYTFTSDIRFEGDNADMGLVVRVKNEKEGVDTYDGYYVGLRTLDGTMVIGRSHFGWAEARPVSVPGGVHSSVWYRMRVTAVGCNIAASTENLSTGQIAWMAFEERSCQRSGRLGLRSLNAGGMWRNVQVAAANWDDYLDMRRHAASVESPEFPPGRPWWTPWHTGLLFAGLLAAALAAQLGYFRIQQWKTNAITRERERLAREIHDTMAQSFAGIGYQIQGIRSSIVRAGHVEPAPIVEQLSVAYQLVRNCHEEASRTISMLSSASPRIQQNLLGALEQTARKIAGDNITTFAEVRGNPVPLNLRLTDALLHIGQEAIANAVHHASPTLLTIALVFEESVEEGAVELVVEDDGAGFDFSPETAGFGILTMQKRASDVAGSFRIVSRPGRGTQVRVKARVPHEGMFMRLLAYAKQAFGNASADLE